MSNRVLPVVLYFLVVCVGTPCLYSAEPTGPELPIPLIGPTGPTLADQAAPPLAIDATPSHSAPAESTARATTSSSSLRWVKRDEQPNRPTIEPIPLAASTPDVDLLPKAEPLSMPTVVPAPALADDTDLVSPEIAADALDAFSELPEVSGSGIVQAAPSLVVEIAGPPRTSVGSVASFHIFLKNMGVVTAEDVSVQAIIPQHADFVASDPPADSTGDRVLQFDVGNLMAEAVYQIRVDLIPRSTGEVRLHTNVGFSVAASSSIHVGRPQLAVRCEAPAATTLGDLVTFRVIVENTGDAQSEHITVIPQVASAGQTDLSAVGLFDIGTLQPGDTKEIVLRAVASREGTMQVRFVASDQFGSEAIADTRVRVRSGGLDVMLIGPVEARPGEEHNYEVQVSNTTDTPAENVRVTCSLPQGFRLTVVESSVQFAPNFAGMTWRVGELAAGATQVLRFKAHTAITEGDHTIRAVMESDSLPNPRTAETTIGIHKQPHYHRTASLR